MSLKRPSANGILQHRHSQKLAEYASVLAKHANFSVLAYLLQVRFVCILKMRSINYWKLRNNTETRSLAFMLYLHIIQLKKQILALRPGLVPD